MITYQDIYEFLEQNPEARNLTATVKVGEGNEAEYLAVESMLLTEETDVLDEDHLVLSIQ